MERIDLNKRFRHPVSPACADSSIPFVRVFFIAFLFYFVLGFFGSRQALNAESVYLPIDHWAYRYFDRMEAKGLLVRILNDTRPVLRETAAAWVSRLDSIHQTNPDVFSRVEVQTLNRLKGDFWDELGGSIATTPKEKEPHLYEWDRETDRFRLDALAGADGAFRSKNAESRERRIEGMSYGFRVRGQLRGLGFYSDNRIFAEWGTRKYGEHYQASLGYPQNAERDSSRATWDVSHSYLSAEWKGFHFQWGRDPVRWGPSFEAGLMLSGLAPAFDLFKVWTQTGPARFTWIHGALRSDFTPKWVSAHRIDLSLARGVDVGLSETVIYARRGLEPAYLNPVLPFLVAQHSLGNRDNMSIGLDCEINRIRGLKLYGELFIDDLFAPWEIFGSFYGNKLAVTAGGYWVEPFGISETGIRFEYTRIEPYVYTHDDSANVFENYNQGLGHFLQPNSDRVMMRFEYSPRFEINTACFVDFTRHGQGDRRTVHRPEDDPSKHFLEGVVEKTVHAGASLNWEFVRDCTFRLEAARVTSENIGHVSGADRSWNEVLIRSNFDW